MTAAHPPVPEITSEQRVGAELRTADDKLMTTQIVVGGRPIAYEPDTADRNARTNVCFWHLADITMRSADVRFRG